jgi:hypothetical protein
MEEHYIVTVGCCCAVLMELLHSMLAKDPHERCKVQQLVGHHWINQDVDMSSYCFQDVVSCRKCLYIIATHVNCREIELIT